MPAIGNDSTAFFEFAPLTNQHWNADLTISIAALRLGRILFKNESMAYSIGQVT